MGAGLSLRERGLLDVNSALRSPLFLLTSGCLGETLRSWERGQLQEYGPDTWGGGSLCLVGGSSLLPLTQVGVLTTLTAPGLRPRGRKMNNSV